MSWPSVSFGDVFEIQLGKMLDAKKNSGELKPYLANRNVQWGACDLTDLALMRFTDADRKKFDLRAGDLLVCEGGEVGRTAIWDGAIQDCYYQKAIHRLRPRRAAEPRFILHYMRWAAERKLFARMTSATSIAHLTKAKLQKVTLPLPPLEEQRRIAAILDASDALRIKRRASLEQLDMLLQSTFLEMFGDPVENLMVWPLRTLPEMASRFTDGPFGSNLKSSHYQESGIRVVRLQNIGVGEMIDTDRAFISEAHFETLPRNHGRSGDLVIGTLGAPNLRACVVPETLDRFLNKADCILMRVSPGVADAQYVCGLLNCTATVNQALSLVRGQTRGRISMGRLKQLRVPLPPLDLQRKFATIVESVEKQKERQRAHLTELDMLFASLQQRAFRGDL